MSVTIKVKDDATPFLNRLDATISSGSLENAMGRSATNLIQRHLFGLNASRPNALGGKRTNFYSAAATSTSYTHQPGAAEITISQLGFRQRLEGGEIRARNVKYLTIPAVAEAHGRRAREFSNLRFGFAENKYGNLQPALIVRSASETALREREAARAAEQETPELSAIRYHLRSRDRRAEDREARKAAAKAARFERKMRKSRKATKQTGPVSSSPDTVMYWLTPRVFQRADPSVLPTSEAIIEAALKGADQYLRSPTGRESLRGETPGGAQ